jgi:hypothetical protein
VWRFGNEMDEVAHLLRSRVQGRRHSIWSSSYFVRSLVFLFTLQSNINTTLFKAIWQTTLLKCILLRMQVKTTFVSLFFTQNWPISYTGDTLTFVLPFTRWYQKNGSILNVKSCIFLLSALTFGDPQGGSGNLDNSPTKRPKLEGEPELLQQPKSMTGGTLKPWVFVSFYIFEKCMYYDTSTNRKSRIAGPPKCTRKINLSKMPTS